MRAAGRRSLPAKAKLALEIAWTYPGVRLALRRDDLPTAVGRLRAGAQPGPIPDAVVQTGLGLGRAVERTLRPLPVDSRCLTQTLVLCKLLARRGVVGTVVIGVRPGDEFAAHAWVELDGRPILSPGAGDFPKLVEL